MCLLRARRFCQVNLDIVDRQPSPRTATSGLFNVAPVGGHDGVAASQRALGHCEVHRVSQP